MQNDFPKFPTNISHFNSHGNNINFNFITEINNKLDRIIDMMQINEINKEFYSVKEVAQILKKSEFTVREYCRNGRIRAEKCDSGRGSNLNWKIPSQELYYYQNHGPRPK